MAAATKFAHKKSKLLVCVDNSPHSHIALRFACSKAKHQGFAVELIHVINSSEYNTNTLFGVGEKIREERRAEVEKLMNEFASEAQQYAGVTPSFYIKEGSLGDEIVKTVTEDGNFNMLVIGKSPHEHSKKDIITQVASELAGKLMIPMIIVPGNLTDQQIEELI